MDVTALSLPVVLPEFILSIGVLSLILIGAIRASARSGSSPRARSPCSA